MTSPALYIGGPDDRRVIETRIDATHIHVDHFGIIGAYRELAMMYRGQPLRVFAWRQPSGERVIDWQAQVLAAIDEANELVRMTAPQVTQ
jgi:hypothetical protein